MKESEEFIKLQKELLYYKKRYYNDSISEISDYEFDMLERKSFKMAKELGFNADKWSDPKDNEKHHIHWMVGYNKTNKYE